jgi:hypothetical protein
MIRIMALAVVLGLGAPDAGPHGSEKTTTWTGWFSDKGCAAPRVARGQIGPNNPDCVKRCLADGAVAVFISEQAKALFEVRDHSSVNEDVGWHVEVTGVVDDTAKTIAVKSVKRLEYVGATCARPKKATR